MTQKLLTVVIPTYNMEKYLRSCLDSLIVSPELMALLEVLVVNDGSKDASSAIGHEYEAKFPGTFRVIDKENGNYGSCVNRGLAEATGKYFRLLDADDRFDSAAFAKYLETAKTLDVDLILNERVFVRPSGEVVKKSSSRFPELTEFEFFPTTEFPVMHCVAYKTENLRRIGYRQTEGISYTDRQFVFTPVATVKRAFFMREYLYLYLVGREGQTMTPATMLRNMDHQTKGLKDMLIVYSQSSYSGDAAVWMKERLKRWLQMLYVDVLIRYNDEKNAALIGFDDFFKEQYPSLYAESEAWLIMSHKFKHKFARYWRTHKKMNRLDFFIPLYRLFLKRFKRSVF